MTLLPQKYEHLHRPLYLITAGTAVAALFGYVPMRAVITLPFFLVLCWWMLAGLSVAWSIVQTAQNSVIEERRRFVRGGFVMGFLTATIIACVVQGAMVFR